MKQYLVPENTMNIMLDLINKAPYKDVNAVYTELTTTIKLVASSVKITEETKENTTTEVVNSEQQT